MAWPWPKATWHVRETSLSVRHAIGCREGSLPSRRRRSPHPVAPSLTCLAAAWTAKTPSPSTSTFGTHDPPRLPCTESLTISPARHELPTFQLAHVQHSKATSAYPQANIHNITKRHVPHRESRHDPRSARRCDSPDAQLCAGQPWGPTEELDDAAALQRACPAAPSFLPNSHKTHYPSPCAVAEGLASSPGLLFPPPHTHPQRT